MISIDKTSVQPFYEQIALSVKQNILLGVLTPEEKLPSVRELASRLMMNPNTIAKAYRSLEQEGVIVTKKGLGTYINDPVKVVPDEEQVEEWKERLRTIVTEARFAGIPFEELTDWVRMIYKGETQ